MEIVGFLLTDITTSTFVDDGGEANYRSINILICASSSKDNSLKGLIVRVSPWRWILNLQNEPPSRPTGKLSF